MRKSLNELLALGDTEPTPAERRGWHLLNEVLENNEPLSPRQALQLICFLHPSVVGEDASFEVAMTPDDWLKVQHAVKDAMALVTK